MSAALLPASRDPTARVPDGVLDGVRDGGRDRVRDQVAVMLGVPACEVVRGRTRTGKPVLASPPGAAFSVAHRQGATLVGAGWGEEVGVDLELVRPGLDVCGIADTFFTAAEAGWLRGLPRVRRPLGFVAVWTVKEAVLKASGRGIAGGLHDPPVDVAGLAPLLAGADLLHMALPGGVAVELRHGAVAGREACVCLARDPGGPRVQPRPGSGVR